MVHSVIRCFVTVMIDYCCKRSPFNLVITHHLYFVCVSSDTLPLVGALKSCCESLEEVNGASFFFLMLNGPLLTQKSNTNTHFTFHLLVNLFN